MFVALLKTKQIEKAFETNTFAEAWGLLNQLTNNNTQVEEALVLEYDNIDGTYEFADVIASVRLIK